MSLYHILVLALLGWLGVIHTIHLCLSFHMLGMLEALREMSGRTNLMLTANFERLGGHEDGLHEEDTP